jgi:two-component system NtrC family sensor kinase
VGEENHPRWGIFPILPLKRLVVKHFCQSHCYLCKINEQVMQRADVQLRERLKELKCLYELSKIALQADNDLRKVADKALVILPSAMQFPEKAEASILVDGNEVSTPGFKNTETRISSPIMDRGKKRGYVAVGYRKSRSEKGATFLPEEKKLIRAVAQEFSLIVKRASAEEEKNKLQLQLQHVERLAFVGELSAGIAHELNEPLGRILGFAQLIKKAGGLNEQQTEDIERIVKASLYTREIIKKLMIFSRQMPRQMTKRDLNEIISNILYFIDVRFVGRQVTIEKKLQENLPMIQADEVQMSQVLVNLITNSIHAMPTGGVLTIATKKKDNMVSLSVSDTGHGMTSEVRRKIFEPFFTTKPPGQGTGLGLSVVQGIVMAHHGKISVTSQPGRGTKVEVLLPLKQTNRET